MAVGDALGLPWEGLGASRISRLCPPGPLKYRFLFGRGMISDDTEHACMAAAALLRGKENLVAFRKSLAWRLRGWLAGIPAGIGWATLRSILKLWAGFPPTRSGVGSAGNGACMRAPILGLLGASPVFVEASTQTTHTDVRAIEGANMAAWAAALPPETEATAAMETLLARCSGAELAHRLQLALHHLRAGSDPREYCSAIGIHERVSGYVNETVPVALFCRYRYHQDFRAAVEAAIRLGGDTDTVAGIVGALSGAALGIGAVPDDLLGGLCDWPRSQAWMRQLATALFQGDRPPRLFWPALPLRNMLFAGVVIAHGLRRLLPPFG